MLEISRMAMGSYFDFLGYELYGHEDDLMMVRRQEAYAAMHWVVFS